MRLYTLANMSINESRQPRPEEVYLMQERSGSIIYDDLSSWDIRVNDYSLLPTPTQGYYAHYSCSLGVNVYTPTGSPDVEIGAGVCGLGTSLWGAAG